jgi:tetratricopeptide (TPR) repeat protein
VTDAVGRFKDGQGAERVRPGELSALLAELGEAPEAGRGGTWDRWLRPGAVVGRFELVREIGRGGFGVVWEARDRELGRSVAFKAVRSGDRPALREERLLREAEAAARLSHPNIVTLHDVGRCEQGPYLVLELLSGQSLAERLAQGPVSPREALRVGVEVAKAIAHAHAQGVVHRDLKPANIQLCDDGNVKVLDFGLAHALGHRRTAGGTPAYMAPEQWRGAPEDERTDVFALGVILYRMLVNALPFPEGDAGRALESTRPAPALEVPETPALGTFVGRMLEKDPVKRPRDGTEVLAALSTFQREIERAPSSDSAPVRTRRRPRLTTAALVASVVLVLALLATGVALRGRWGPGPAAQERITVAVADFANQTGEPELNGLSGMLITSLEQSRKLSVLTRARMVDLLRQAGRSNVETVDEALGRELALGAGVRALVLASIRRFDQLYAIEMKVLDPATSEYLFTLKEEGTGKASVPGMIDRLSERARERLRETHAEVQASRVKVADATTASFEAWQHYAHGDQLKVATRYPQAIEEYRKAIAVDPSFALAHYWIAYLGQFTGLDEASRRDEMEAALRHVDRVPPKERLLFQAWKAVMDGRREEAHALYQRIVEDYPLDKEAQFMAGDLYLHEGKYVEGLPYFERAVALDPSWDWALMHLTDSLAFLGRKEDLTQRAQAWVAMSPGGSSYKALSMAHLLNGRIDDSVDAARRAYELTQTPFARETLAQALILAERYTEAEALVRPFAAPAASRFERGGAIPSLAAAVAYQGRRREALSIAETLPVEEDGKALHRQVLRLELLIGDGNAESVLSEARSLAASITDPEKRAGVPMILALFGDFEGAETAAANLRPGPHRQMYEAAVAWRRGDRDRATLILRELVRNPASEERAPALWMLANVAWESRRDQETVTAVEALRTAPGGLWRSSSYPQSLYLAALAHERLGNRAKALETVDRLLRNWTRPDLDLPYLADARALKARLGRPGAVRNSP